MLCHALSASPRLHAFPAASQCIIPLVPRPFVCVCVVRRRPRSALRPAAASPMRHRRAGAAARSQSPYSLCTFTTASPFCLCATGGGVAARSQSPYSLCTFHTMPSLAHVLCHRRSAACERHRSARIKLLVQAAPQSNPGLGQSATRNLTLARLALANACYTPIYV